MNDMTRSSQMFPYGYIAPTTGTVCKALADGSLHN